MSNPFLDALLELELLGSQTERGEVKMEFAPARELIAKGKTPAQIFTELRTQELIAEGRTQNQATSTAINERNEIMRSGAHAVETFARRIAIAIRQKNERERQERESKERESEDRRMEGKTPEQVFMELRTQELIASGRTNEQANTIARNERDGIKRSGPNSEERFIREIGISRQRQNQRISSAIERERLESAERERKESSDIERQRQEQAQRDEAQRLEEAKTPETPEAFGSGESERQEQPQIQETPSIPPQSALLSSRVGKSASPSKVKITSSDIKQIGNVQQSQANNTIKLKFDEKPFRFPKTSHNNVAYIRRVKALSGYVDGFFNTSF